MFNMESIKTIKSTFFHPKTSESFCFEQARTKSNLLDCSQVPDEHGKLNAHLT